MKKIGAVSALCLGISALFAQEANAFCQKDEIQNRQRIDAAFDLTSGRLIYGNADTSFYQASMTKRVVELLVLEAVRDGRLNWDDRIELPSVHLRNGSANPVIQNSDAIPFEYKSISVRDGFIAGNRGSSNRFMQGVMTRLAGSEELGVDMINKRYEELGLEGQAQAAQVAGYPTIAMKYKAAGQPSNHFITPYAHALIVWKIEHDFADVTKDLYLPKPELTAYNSSGAHEYKLKITSHLLPGDKMRGANEAEIKSLKTGTACGTGSAADYVAQVTFNVEGQEIKRDIVYITAGHTTGTERDRHAHDFLANLPETAKEELKTAARDWFGVVQESFAAHVANAERKTHEAQTRLALLETFNRPMFYSLKQGPAYIPLSPPGPFDFYAPLQIYVREEDIEPLGYCAANSSLTPILT